MKLFFIIFICLVLPVSGYTQDKTISGEVWNYEKNEPMAYVNIGIKDKAAGTVTNKNGLFKLLLNGNVTSTDTVVFSHVGFKTRKYLISTLKKNKEPILLEPKNMELDEVVVRSEKVVLKAKKIGRTSKGLGLTHSNFYTYYEKSVDDRLSKEKGMKLNIRRNCHIKDLNFNITTNDFKSLQFRINFYKIENGLPTDLIVQENIIFQIKDNFLGWFKVDLEPYDIRLKEEIDEVGVTIQWIESVKTNEKSKYFALSAASSPTHTAFFREKAMDTWSKGGQSLSFYLNAMCE